MATEERRGGEEKRSESKPPNFVVSMDSSVSLVST